MQEQGSQTAAMHQAVVSLAMEAEAKKINMVADQHRVHAHQHVQAHSFAVLRIDDHKKVIVPNPTIRNVIAPR